MSWTATDASSRARVVRKATPTPWLPSSIQYSRHSASDSSPADQQLALFEEQRKALEQEIVQKQKHLVYLEQKVAYWKAVKSGDGAKVKEIGEIPSGLIQQLINEK